MTIDGVTYTEKEDAGRALIERCKATASPEAIIIGNYRGFDLELSFDTFHQQHILSLKHQIRHPVELGLDTFGNITRIDNVLDKMTERLETHKRNLEETKKQLEIAKVESKKEFPQEAELKEKEQRLAALDALLNMDKHDHEGSELGISDDDNVPPTKKKDEMER